MTKIRDYQVGDRICTFNDKGVVIKLNNPPFAEFNLVFVQWDNGTETGISESQIWHEGGTPKFDYMAHQAKLEHAEKLKLSEERRVLERAFDEEVRAYPNKLKYKVGDRVRWEMFGCGTVVNASPYIVTVKFAHDYERNLSTYPPMRLATEEDEQYDACAVIWQPEPIDETATLEELAKKVSRWAEIVQYLDGGNDQTDTEYQLDARAYLHGTLNGLKKQGLEIPTRLLKSLLRADQYFMDHSFALEPPDVEQLINRSPCMGPVELLDVDAFWYEYRWPKAK